MVENKGIEIAKSWFVLAEILAIISGLFVFSGGFFIISFQESIGTIETSMIICEKGRIMNYSYMQNKTTEECFNEIIENIFEGRESTQEISYFLIFTGFVLVFFSLYIWVLGKLKMRDFDFRDVFFGIVALVIFFGLEIILWSWVKNIVY